MTVPIPPPPESRAARGQRLAVVVVVALVGLGLLAVLLVVAVRVWSGGDSLAGAPPAGTPSAPAATAPDADEQQPSPSPVPTGGDPEEPPEASPSPLQGPRPDGIDEITAQVSALRGLPTGDPLDVRVVPPADLGSRLAELAFAEYEDADIEADERLLQTLRLLDMEADLRATVEELYGAQVLGLYVVEEQVLYVAGEDVGLTAAQRITAAHEVLHALQDSAFGLEAFMDLDDRESDAALARLALVEGDAMLTQELWSQQHQSPGERQDALEESNQRSQDPLLEAPPYVRESLLFPYTAGARFVEALVLADGFAGIDAAFADPPASTRHVLRPETYLAGERHTGAEVTTTPPGDGWDEASTYTFGEFDVDHWLSALGDDRLAVTEGWDGGETRHWRREGDDAVALALRLADPAAAEAACAAVPAWYAAVASGEQAEGGVHRGDRDWMAVTCDDLDVLVGLAADPDVAEALAGR